VKLLACLRDNRIEGKMVFIGDYSINPYYVLLRNEIKKLKLENSIQIMPMVDQGKLINLYHKSDFCFFPSLHKTGFSRVPIEAMACGCVIISYGNEGSDEIIENGENGFLIPEGDFIHASRIINCLIQNPSGLEKIINNARKKVETKHVMKSYINNIEEIIIKAG
jgi:glycosyltransferase involved in cell wall biosynthesis